MDHVWSYLSLNRRQGTTNCTVQVASVGCPEAQEVGQRVSATYVKTRRNTHKYTSNHAFQYAYTGMHTHTNNTPVYTHMGILTGTQMYIHIDTYTKEYVIHTCLCTHRDTHTHTCP